MRVTLLHNRNQYNIAHSSDCAVSLGANFLPKIIVSNPTDDTIVIEHRCFSKECLCAYFGMSLFKGICVPRDLCMCIALCVIPWCVGDEQREKRKKLRQRKNKYEGKMLWTCKERNSYLWQKKKKKNFILYIKTLYFI